MAGIAGEAAVPELRQVDQQHDREQRSHVAPVRGIQGQKPCHVPGHECRLVLKGIHRPGVSYGGQLQMPEVISLSYEFV
jgi:hypothetical protein